MWSTVRPTISAISSSGVASATVARADRAAVAEDAVMVGDAEDLLELVADEEDRLPLALQLGDDRVELLHLLVGERRGRLVHDDDLGVDGERARDRDEVLARDGEVAEPHVGIDVDLQLAEDRLRRGRASPSSRASRSGS